MYFLLIRPQKKREKATNQMRNSLQVGDEVVTIGGICGRIVKVKDETLIIQVGAEKIKFEIMRWSISKVANNDSNTSTRREKGASSEDATEEAPKKVIPKKMFKKPEASVEEKVIEIPEEDVIIVEENSEEK
jgi:preprotein translocase subunit YajC